MKELSTMQKIFVWIAMTSVIIMIMMVISIFFSVMIPYFTPVQQWIFDNLPLMGKFLLLSFCLTMVAGILIAVKQLFKLIK